MPLFDMSENSFLHQPQINVYTFGRPPVCIEILKEIYTNALNTVFEQIPMKVFHINDLKRNKTISCRAKDLNDLENLSKI